MAKYSWSAQRVLNAKSRIVSAAEIRQWLGRKLVGRDYTEFVIALHARLPKRIDVAVVHESLQHLLGVPLTATALDAAVWRLLGNLPLLREGRPVLPWRRQACDEDVPVQVLRVLPAASSVGRIGGRLTLQSLTGTSCPLQFSTFWSKEFSVVASRRLGFSPPWGKNPFRDMAELVNMRFVAHVKQSLSQEHPGFKEMSVDSLCLQWNRRVLRMRRREPGWHACPEGFPPEEPCYRCYVGLDGCPAATHDVTYVQRRCPECQQEDAWFDPALKGVDVCLSCWRQRVLSRSHLEEKS